MLSPRQELLLSKVVDAFAASGHPVGSKALAEDPEITSAPSTIRNELAVLEELGLLAHPHTSAGRVPTDAGYRSFAARPSPPWAPPPSRTELAVLEGLGLLAHPHTSAGRVPTDAGYRYFVDRLLPQ